MWILAGAVVTASVLGSMHCVGMCGPLAIWASGAADRGPGNGRQSRRRLAGATTLYHLGRLVTYALAGVLAGLVGELADFGGEVLGVQLAAARIVGSIMIVVGGVRLTQLFWARRQGSISAKSPVATPLKPSPITRVLVSLRPFVFSLPMQLRALVTGLLTAFLPCGWLYLFALVAAGTGDWLLGPVVMVAFWLGTVPALVGVVTGTRLLAGKFRQAIPFAAAIMLIVAGGYTASGRGFANLSSLAEIRVASLHGENLHGENLHSEKTYSEKASDDQPAAQSTGEVAIGLAKNIDDIVKTPLPCCVGKQTTAGAPAAGAQP